MALLSLSLPSFRTSSLRCWTRLLSFSLCTDGFISSRWNRWCASPSRPRVTFLGSDRKTPPKPPPRLQLRAPSTADRQTERTVRGLQARVQCRPGGLWPCSSRCHNKRRRKRRGDSCEAGLSHRWDSSQTSWSLRVEDYWKFSPPGTFQKWLLCHGCWLPSKRGSFSKLANFFRARAGVWPNWRSVQ